MITFNDIKGQPNAIKYLRGSLSSGRISNSYLFSGPDGVGRSMTARAFIMALVCRQKKDHEGCGVCDACSKVTGGNHPDVKWITPEKNKSIKIEEIRNIKEVLSLKPYEARYSVCVIEDAHLMTQSSSNALLKIMEEPPGDSLILLITNKKELLLDTVISRCSEVRFHALSSKDTKDIITRENPEIERSEAYFLSYFSQGSPGKALELAGESVRERKTELIEFAGKMLQDDNLSCLNWDKDTKNDILEDLEMMIMFFRDITLANEGLGKMVLDEDLIDTGMYDSLKEYSTDSIYSIVERLINMKRALMSNVNPKIVAQALPSQFKI